MWGEGTGNLTGTFSIWSASHLAAHFCVATLPTDLSNFFTSVWPQLTMVAERLWSGPSPPGGLDLLTGRKWRLRRHRCRLVSRGVPVGGIGAMIYTPDASHASFATWRESAWCPGDENWRQVSLDVQRDASEGMEWAAEALRAAERARARAVSTPFD